MLELWAKREHIDIVLVQETHINQAGMERRRHYTIFFSENEEMEENGNWQRLTRNIGIGLTRY